MTYFIFVLIALVVGIVIVKKITSCLIKSVIAVAIIAALVILWFMYFS